MKNIIITFLFSIFCFAAIGQNDCPIDWEEQTNLTCDIIKDCVGDIGQVESVTIVNDSLVVTYIDATVQYYDNIVNQELQDTVIFNALEFLTDDWKITCHDHYTTDGVMLRYCDTLLIGISQWKEEIGDSIYTYTATPYDTSVILNFTVIDTTMTSVTYTTYEEINGVKCQTDFDKCKLCDLVADGQLDGCDPSLEFVDCDGGGITNLLECQYGFNPNDPSDDDCVQFVISGQSICDFLTANPNSSIGALDCDNSGVSNKEECDNGNDPIDPADDCPYIITNNIDVCAGVNYQNTDCDGGGVPAFYECIAGGDPNGDPTDDCTSAINGGANICQLINNNPNHPLANLDCDGNGYPNLVECQNQLNPNDPSDDMACVELTKTATLVSGIAVGDVVNYSLTAKNCGKFEGDITVTDPIITLTPTTAQTVAAGSTATWTGSYTITQADVDADSLKNTATASITDIYGVTATDLSDNVGGDGTSGDRNDSGMTQNDATVIDLKVVCTGQYEWLWVSNNRAAPNTTCQDWSAIASFCQHPGNYFLRRTVNGANNFINSDPTDADTFWGQASTDIPTVTNNACPIGTVSPSGYYTDGSAPLLQGQLQDCIDGDFENAAFGHLLLDQEHFGEFYYDAVFYNEKLTDGTPVNLAYMDIHRIGTGGVFRSAVQSMTWNGDCEGEICLNWQGFEILAGGVNSVQNVRINIYRGNDIEVVNPNSTQTILQTTTAGGAHNFQVNSPLLQSENIGDHALNTTASVACALRYNPTNGIEAGLYTIEVVSDIDQLGVKDFRQITVLQVK